MKNKTNKLLIAVIALLSVSSLAGCDSANSIIKDGGHIYIDEHNVATTGYEDVHVDSSSTYFEGIHEFNYKPTSKPFIKQGKTSYKVVLPSVFSSEIGIARDELIHFFKIATDITLEWVNDEGLTHNSENRYISIGNTTLLETSGIKIDYEYLTPDGCRIVTKGNTIFLVGGTDIGTLNTVYDFLHILFKYEQYSPDVYEIDRNVKNMVLYNFDVTDVPDVAHRAQNYGFLLNGNGDYDQSKYGYRLRMSKGRGYYMMPVYKEFSYTSPSKTSTNTDTYVPYATYVADHPKWFSDLSTSSAPQLCYTAHGDAEELEGLIDLVYRKIIFSMQRFTPATDPNMNVCTFTMEDNFNICNCKWCTEDRDTYGAYSASLVKFVNEVARRVDRWQKLPENAEYYRPTFQIIYFAYNGYVDAPVKYDSTTKSYIPSHKDVVLEPNTGVYLAIIDRGDFQFDFFDNPIKNAGVTGDMGCKETFESWGALTDDIYLWLYETNFSLYQYFFDSFSFYTQPMYNFVASKGLRMFFSQGQDTKASGQSGTNFNNLKAYLNAKLTWDSTLDQTTLMNRYFKAMYGRAADAVWNYYGLLRGFYYDMLMKNSDTLINNRSIYNKYNTKANLPLASLRSLIKAIDAAKELITLDYYSEEEYNLYRYNIEAEGLFPLYAQLELYGSVDLTVEDRKALAQRILDLIYAMRLDGMSTREHSGSILELPLYYL